MCWSGECSVKFLSWFPIAYMWACQLAYRVFVTDSYVIDEYVTYPSQIVTLLKAVTSSFPSNQTARYFSFLSAMFQILC